MLWRVVDTLVGSAEAVVKEKKRVSSDLTCQVAVAVGEGMDENLTYSVRYESGQK